MKIKSLFPCILVLLMVFSCKNNNKTEGEIVNPESDVQFSPTPNEISRKDTLGRTIDSTPVSREEEELPKELKTATTSPTKQIYKG
ncbi:hypothetical protein LZ575_21050 [Antarcticibacterium sp. 1MA-6-2]|uniref:hypothetical protein n=1 Tax=Antarcticibacterium sp. 1MA-6-2 TaxID=2908210 RepID=UPI001F1DB4A3|nr:hypothetical protein [Antarcticibacterium sp. 1MA-6-2]UJH91105.1 hypothetical protein LZ575_21050 [Antarcticibacterium sp. 1MA-6-2]